MTESSDMNSSLMVPKKCKIGSMNNMGKNVDVFISYRRSTGAQLARFVKGDPEGR